MEVTLGLTLSQFFGEFGVDGIKKLHSSKILILGLNGIGAEVAKNLVLTGSPLISLHDKRIVESSDLASSYLLRDSDVGKNRAEVHAARLLELRKYANVSVHTEDITESTLKTFDCVCLTEAESIQHLISINNMCRNQCVPFMAGETFGALGFIFNDFGDAWHSTDLHCVKSKQYCIDNITGTPLHLEVKVDPDQRCRIQSGARVTLTDLPKLPQINNRRYKVVATNEVKLELATDDDNTGSEVSYSYGGYIEEVLESKTFQFQPFSKFLDSEIKADFDDKVRQSNALVQALYLFKEKHTRLPRPWNESDADQVLNNVQTIINFDQSIDKHFVLQLAKVSGCTLVPMVNIFGGVLAHEIVKCVIHQGTPIDQFMFYDAVKCLPSITEADINLTNTRDDALIQVFGGGLAGKIRDSNLLLVGAGSIGCEILKILGLMGVATREGKIEVLDQGALTTSHLAHHSLYRADDVQKPKAKSAIVNIKQIEARINAKYLVSDVDQFAREHNDEHWCSFDFIFNAVKSTARAIVGDKAIFLRKPFVDCGIDGALGHTQDVVPFITESCKSSQDYREEFVPRKWWTFPSSIQDCVLFARDSLFEQYYRSEAETAENYITNAEYLQQNHNVIESIMKNLGSSLIKQPKDFEDCVIWSRKVFEKKFNIGAKNLLHSMPLDTIDRNSGELFWSGHKRPPTPLIFDADDPTHFSFIEAAALLKAEVYNISTEEFTSLDSKNRTAFLKKISMGVKFPPFVPKKYVEEEQQTKTENIRQSLPDRHTIKAPKALKFDNYNDIHMSFVHTASTLRARSYSIPEVDHWKTTLLAGKNVPKIVATASAIAGFACMEFIKIRIGLVQTEHICNNWLNLNVGLFHESDPLPPPVKKFSETKFTLWDKIEIREGDITVQELLNYLMQNFRIEVDLMASGVRLLWTSWQPTSRARLGQKVSEVYNRIYSREENPEYILLEICGTDMEGNEFDEHPPIVYYLSKSSLPCSL